MVRKVFKKILPVLALSTTLFFPAKTNADSISISLFPEAPVCRSVMPDSDIPKTGINIPFGIENEILNKPFTDILPYISLSKELPVLSVDIKTNMPPAIIPADVASYQQAIASARGKTLSDKLFSASLIATGSLSFPEGKNLKYNSRLELFLDSPVIDDYLSDGNKLLLVAGAKSGGQVNFENQKILSVPEMFLMNSYDFFADSYIVAKSPYSDQYVILKTGIDNILAKMDKTNINLSAVVEFPSLVSWIDALKDFKISPYISINAKFPLSIPSQKRISGEAGIKLTGESKKSAIIYAQTSLEDDKELTSSFGLKLDL